MFENLDVLKIKIADRTVFPNEDTILAFKAYLEDHAIQYKIKEQSLPFTPISFVNDKVHTRTTQSVRLKFNVVSENLKEAVNNYINLLDLIEKIKPRYNFTNEQFLPFSENNTGLLTVKWKGLPMVRPKDVYSAPEDSYDDLPIHLTNFSHNINKEMGFIEVPVESLDFIDSIDTNDNNYAKYSADNMRLIPIGFSIEIVGNILLQFQETARVSQTVGTRAALFTAVEQSTEESTDASGGEPTDEEIQRAEEDATAARERATAARERATAARERVTASRTPNTETVAAPAAPPTTETASGGATEPWRPRAISQTADATFMPIEGLDYADVYYRNTSAVKPGDKTAFYTLNRDDQQAAIRVINSAIYTDVLDRTGTYYREKMPEQDYEREYTRLQDSLNKLENNESRFLRGARRFYNAGEAILTGVRVLKKAL